MATETAESRHGRSAARLLMSRLAGAMSDLRSTDPVRYADLRTSMDDARTALCLAGGVDHADIDHLGFNVSRGAYERSRASWVRMFAEDPSDWTVRGATKARANWMRRRPDWDDDWGIPVTNDAT